MLSKILKSNAINKYLGIVLIFLLSPSGGYAAGSSVSQWSGAVVYTGNEKVSSGVPVSKCHVLSNEHAVRGNKRIIISIEGLNHNAVVISTDKVNDLALMKLDTCTINHYAKISKVGPVRGDKMTSIYYKAGFLTDRIIKTSGRFVGYINIITEEHKKMNSMVIDDTQPERGASGGGVSTQYGLVSVIFGIAGRNAKRPRTFAVNYHSLTHFLSRNNI